MKRSIALLGLFGFFLFLVSCSEDSEMVDDMEMEEEMPVDSSTVDTMTMVLTPSFWKKDGEVLGKIFYDEEDRIVDIKTYTNFEMDYYDFRFQFIEYGPDGLTKSTRDQDGGMTVNASYFYKDQLLDSIHFSSGGFHSYTLLFHSDDEDCSIDSTRHYEEDEYRSTVAYEYLDGRCSVTRTNSTSQVTIIFDDKPGFGHKREYYEVVPFPLLLEPAKHNILSLVYTDIVTNEVDEDASFNAEYEYNEYGYPISEKRTFYDGTIREYTFHYEEK